MLPLCIKQGSTQGGRHGGAGSDWHGKFGGPPQVCQIGTGFKAGTPLLSGGDDRSCCRCQQLACLSSVLSLCL